MTAITFTLPFIPKSLKNTKGIDTRRGKTRHYKPREISQEQAYMGLAVIEALRRAKLKLPRDKSFFGDDDIAVETVVNATTKETTITVRSVGPKPEGVTGRSFDLVNVMAGPHDAMQGILFDNDSQIVSNTETRILTPPTKGTK